MASLIIVPDGEALAAAAATRLTDQLASAAAASGDVVLGLTGGHTPKRLYELLADRSQPFRARMPWQKLSIIWSDERHVPPEHPDSNFGMASRALLQHVPVAESRVSRMAGETPDAQLAARDYEVALRRAFAAIGRRDVACDLLLLGIGEDAHIASIFPGSPLLDEEHREPNDALPNVGAVWAQHLRAWRITLTPAAILKARAIVVVAGGSAKAAAVAAALEKPLNVHRWPAQLLRQADDRVTWMVDADAAALLSRGGPTA